MEALADKCAAAGSEIDYFIPTPHLYGSKAAFFNDNDPQSTQVEIETTFINALWIDYKRFEDSNESHAPVKTLYFEFTVFHEDSAERIDESDDFEKKILAQKQAHIADVITLAAEFQGGDNLVLGDEFAVSEYASLKQNENTVRDTECSFIRNGVTGSETKLECAVRIQTVAC